MRSERSADMKAPHQIFSCFDGKFRIHPAEDLFAAFRVHCRQIADHFLSRFPFRIAARADPDRERRGYDPNGDIGPSYH